MNESLRIFYIDAVLSYSNSFEKFYPLKCTVKVLGRYYSRRGQITEKCEWDKKLLLGGKCCCSGCYFDDKNPGVEIYHIMWSDSTQIKENTLTESSGDHLIQRFEKIVVAETRLAVISPPGIRFQG